MDGTLRIYLSKQAHKIYQDNCEDGKLFTQFTDLFFWCVLLGYKNSPATIPPDLVQRGGTFYWSAFDDEIQKPILKSICVMASGTFNILKPDPKKGYEKFRDILQNYAELGFTMINARLGGNFSKDSIDKLMGTLIDISELELK